MHKQLKITAVVSLWIATGLSPHLSAQSNPTQPDGTSPRPLTFTPDQVAKGRSDFSKHCAGCHGVDMEGGQFAPQLRGHSFVSRWAGKPVGDFFSKITTTMPPGNAGTLPTEDYVAIIAAIAEASGATAGSVSLPADASVLGEMAMPGERTMEQVHSRDLRELTPGVVLPVWPIEPGPLERYSSVTDATLNEPPDGSWLSWRGTRDGQGYSPLKQITLKNVRDLRVAWSLGLPAGSNQATPVVHDGVIFVYSYGDHLQALDAASGDELWHYSRKLPAGTAATVHRNIALYDDKVYLATSDTCMVALEAKTGKVVWEQSLGDPKLTWAHSGPLAARGVIMQGLSGIIRPGGGYILGLDAATGRHLWRFNTIAQDGDPHENSWNGLPIEKRTGGSVWTAGSYDPESGLAFFGVAPTYNTGPLRDRIARPGMTNDALYTDATLALEPTSGRLVWHYQHLPNDQWNMDWAFERQIVQLPVNGKERRLLITAGKAAIYDALDARTGEYAFSFDLGLQNFITAIDPKTGAKSIDPALVPGNGKRITFCPDQGGGRNWLPGSYDPGSHLLYAPLVEACMELIPVPPGEPANLSTGVRWTLRPRPDSDGRYGRLQAINLQTRRTAWTNRQRSPFSTGLLTTAGGVLFAGSLDRWFTAFDARTGKRLWKTRISDIPNAAPITYLARGRQYVAVVAGVGNWGQILAYPALIPEMHLPVVPSSAIWVFELPN